MGARAMRAAREERKRRRRRRRGRGLLPPRHRQDRLRALLAPNERHARARTRQPKRRGLGTLGYKRRGLGTLPAHWRPAFGVRRAARGALYLAWRSMALKSWVLSCAW